MAENSAISWTDHTFNPWLGCQKTGSKACEHCYAEAYVAGRFGRTEWGGPHIGPGTRVKTSKSTWAKLRKWNLLASTASAPVFVFCASLADIFDPVVDPAWRREAFDAMRAAPHLTFLLLTKRPQLIEKLAAEAGGLPPNAAIGCTVVTQAEADRDIPHLLRAKAALRPAFAFVSIEPMMEAIDLTNLRDPSHFPGCVRIDALRGREIHEDDDDRWTAYERLDWVITGGETTQGKHTARPSSSAWFYDIRDACAEAGVPYQHKQNGEYLCDDVVHDYDEVRHYRANRYQTVGVGPAMRIAYRVGKKVAGRKLQGVEHNARPQVRKAA